MSNDIPAREGIATYVRSIAGARLDDYATERIIDDAMFEIDEMIANHLADAAAARS